MNVCIPPDQTLAALFVKFGAAVGKYSSVDER